MYKEIGIRNFLCFNELVLEDLGRINLIVGKNNVGKTALLEAIFLHLGLYNPSLLFNINSFRGISSWDLPKEKPWEYIFANKSEEIEIFGKVLKKDDKESREGRISIKLSPATHEDIPEILNLLKNMQFVGDASNIGKDKVFLDTNISEFTLKWEVINEFNQNEGVEKFFLIMPFPLFFQPIFQHPIIVPHLSKQHFMVGTFLPSNQRLDPTPKFSELVREKKKESIIEALKIVEHRLLNLELANISGKITIFFDIGLDKLIPINFAGEGMNKILNIFLSISEKTNSVVLIDEIENGLHYSILEEFWRHINNFSKKYNTQIFATTHSYECILNAYNALNKDNEEDFRLFRIEKIDENIIVDKYNMDRVHFFLDKNLELR